MLVLTYMSANLPYYFMSDLNLVRKKLSDFLSKKRTDLGQKQNVIKNANDDHHQ